MFLRFDKKFTYYVISVAICAEITCKIWCSHFYCRSDFNLDLVTSQGCPLKHTVINPREVVVRWDGLQAASVQNPVTFNISVPAATSFDDIPLEAMVTDASGQRIPVQLNRAGNYGMTATFVPVRVGKMTISVLACGEHVIGSPFASFAYDASAVRIENVSQPGIVGREMCFTGRHCVQALLSYCV